MWVEILRDHKSYRRGERKTIPTKEAIRGIAQGWAIWIRAPKETAVEKYESR